MPQHTNVERLKAKRAAEAAATGNKNPSKLTQAFAKAGKLAGTVAGKAQAAGQSALNTARDLGSRGAAVLRNTFRGTPEPTTTRAGSIGGGGTGGTGGAGIDVTQDRPPARGPRAGLQNVKNLAKGTPGAVVGGAVQSGRLQQLAEGPIGQIPGLVARTSQFAPLVTMIDKGLRLARGESPTEASVEPGLSGLRAASGGLIDIEGSGAPDPLQITGGLADQSPVQIGRQALGIQEDEEPAPITPGGLREFTRADIGRGAANRGTASVEQNQEVLGRLLAERGEAGLPIPSGPAAGAGGLRGGFAGQQPGQQADPTATRLAQQAGGGGIASAFGALALSGNQLRRQAADRTRAASLGESEAERQKDLNVALIGQQGKLATADATTQQNFQNNLDRTLKSIGDARTEGNETQLNTLLDSTFSVGISRPGSHQSIIAAVEVGSEIRDIVGRGFLDSLDPSTERGLFDLVASLGQGGQAEPLLTVDGQITINAQTGNIEIRSNDGSTRQVLDDIQDLSPRAQEFLRARAFFTNQGQLANQPGDPTLTGPGAVQ